MNSSDLGYRTGRAIVHLTRTEAAAEELLGTMYVRGIPTVKDGWVQVDEPELRDADEHVWEPWGDHPRLAIPAWRVAIIEWDVDTTGQKNPPEAAS